MTFYDFSANFTKFHMTVSDFMAWRRPVFVTKLRYIVLFLFLFIYFINKLHRHNAIKRSHWKTKDINTFRKVRRPKVRKFWPGNESFDRQK